MAIPIDTPVCDFVCGPLDENDRQSALCHNICEAYKDCAITPNIAYVFFSGLLFGGQDLFTGTIALLKDRIGSLSLTVGIYQQLPWIISFILLVFVLAYSGSIGTLAAIVLIIAAIFLVGLFLFLSHNEVSNKVPLIAEEAREQFLKDYERRSEEVTDRITIPLFNAIDASKVPCGCSCPDLNPVNGDLGNNSTCTFSIIYTSNIDTRLLIIKRSFEAVGGYIDTSTSSFALPSLIAIQLPSINGSYTIDRSRSVITFNLTRNLSSDNCRVLRLFFADLIQGIEMNVALIRAKSS